MSLPLWVRWIGVNLLFGVCHPWLATALPTPLQSLAVNALLFVLPAAGWSPLFGAARGLGMRLTSDVAISTCALLGFLAIVRWLAITPTPALAWSSMWLVANLGFACSVLVRSGTTVRESLPMRDLALGGALFISSYGLYYWGATQVVPAQEDHDLEVQATGYGLLTRFEPLLLTDRDTIYYFAHPPLLHLYVGGAFLYYGALPDLEVFDAASRRARDDREGHPFEPFRGTVRVGPQDHLYRAVGVEGHEYVLSPEGGGPQVRAPVQALELKNIVDRYRDRPYPLETRTPNLYFASATVALLGVWAGRISRRWWMGLLAATAYATGPEIFVRSSYGGYFAIGGFAAVLMLLAAERWRRSPTWRQAGLPMVTGALAAWADHKLVLLPAALGIQAAFAWWRGGRQRLAAFLDPVVVGFGLGTVLYWCFGLAIAPAAFIQDHFHHHLLDRVTHQNPLQYGGYPTAVGLWLEFVRHTAYVLLPIGLFLMIYDLTRSRIQSAQDRLPLRGVWLLWILLTAAVFTVVDWRMTKHLVPILLPLYLGIVPDPDAQPWRTALPGLTFLFVAVCNVWTVVSLAQDFAGFRVTPVW